VAGAERLLAALTSCFGAFAVSLSAIGLYAILAYFVARRRKEIGLRLALGANSHDVIWFVVRRVVDIRNRSSGWDGRVVVSKRMGSEPSLRSATRRPCD